jgi:hypothetical protein
MLSQIFRGHGQADHLGDRVQRCAHLARFSIKGGGCRPASAANAAATQPALGQIQIHGGDRDRRQPERGGEAREGRDCPEGSHRTMSGDPIGISRARRRMSLFRIRMQPCETRPGINPG